MNWDRGLTANIWELYDITGRVGQVIRLGAIFKVMYGGDLIGTKDDLESAKLFLESYVRHQHQVKGL